MSVDRRSSRNANNQSENPRPNCERFSVSFSAGTGRAALAHVGDAAEQAYRPGDALEKRRQLMEAWAKYCDRKTNVIALVRSVR